MSSKTQQYGYIPSKPAALFGIIFFGTCMLVCIGQVFLGRYRHHWMLVLAIAALGEAIGWGGRLWAHYAPLDWMPFMIQICSLIISPVFISATDYVLFCKIGEKIGSQTLGISTRFLWVVFVTSDIISLAIQTVGGVEVCGAKNYTDLAHGSDVMRSGIIFQFSVTAVFCVLIVWTIYRLRSRGAETLVSAAGWPTTMAMVVSSGMVLVRNGYRIAELSRGWKGMLMRTEGYLIGFDLGPMAVSVGVFVVLSPCWFFEKTGRGKKWEDRGQDCHC